MKISECRGKRFKSPKAVFQENTATHQGTAECQVCAHDRQDTE